jgi:hypothetical protein
MQEGTCSKQDGIVHANIINILVVAIKSALRSTGKQMHDRQTQASDIASRSAIDTNATTMML